MLPNLKHKKLIGSGSFGNVYRAKLDGKPVAVKILHERFFREPHSHNKYFSQFEAECKILQNLQHKNVVTLLEFIISHTSPPMLITELLDCDLREHIRDCHPGFHVQKLSRLCWTWRKVSRIFISKIHR